MKNILKKIFALFGLKVSKLNPENKILKNVYHTNFQKAVLISYLRAPFLSDITYSHTNYTECKTAADIFNELEYNVDVVEYTENQYEIDFSQYNIVYGFGCQFERVFFSEHAEKVIKIMYSTGCNAFYAHNKSALRVNEAFQKTGLLMPQSTRVVDYFWTFQYINSDLIIALGNNFVAQTYRTTNPAVNVLPVNAFYFDVFDIDIDKKEFETARKNFLWFGSSGLLHKGLDIVIDIFAKRSDINLHICGAFKGEKKFFNYYGPIIDACPNITDHGFVDIYSETFKDIMLTCGSFIFPSVSEGGAVSALNVIANGGLIPIISEAAGLDLDEIGYVFSEINENSIVEQIGKVLNMNENDFIDKAKLCKQLIRTNYSYELYKTNLKKAICHLIPDY
jgi:hypothetical protein